MTKKLNLVAVIALTLSVLAISGCGKNDIDDTATNTQTGEVVTGDNTVTVTVETGSTDTGSTMNGSDTAVNLISKEISYEVPSGQPASITVTATLDADRNIKNISVAGKFSEEKTQGYQKAFSDNISAAVVGKKLSEANVDKLAGASLTSAAFNLAIADIQTK